MNLACKNAIVERDVAHLIFPDDVQTLPAGDAEATQGPEGRVALSTIAPDAGLVGDIIDRLEAASRPIIIVGYGALEGMPEVIALAEKLHAPILTTFKGKGLISDHHPLGCGVIGRSGVSICAGILLLIPGWSRR